MILCISFCASGNFVMILGKQGVKYGLEVRQPSKKQAAPPKRGPSVFGDEDSDEEAPNVEQQIARQAARKQTDKKVGWLGVTGKGMQSIDDE